MRGPEAEFVPQQAEIVVRVVEDALDRRVGEHFAQPRKAGHRQGIDEVGLGPGGELHQVDAVAMPMKARGLGVHRDQRRGAKAGQQRGEFVGVVHQAERATRHCVLPRLRGQE